MSQFACLILFIVMCFLIPAILLFGAYFITK